MALKIRTSDGKTFHRCGIKFTGDPIVVGEKILKILYGSPGPSKTNPITVREVLLAEKMLVCKSTRDADEKTGNGGANAKGK